MPDHAGDAWRRGDNAVVVYIAHHPAKQRRDDDGHQHRRMNVARSENRNNKESENPSSTLCEVRLPMLTSVSVLATITPAFFSPIMPINRPMPLVMPTRRLTGMLAIIQ